MAHATRDVPVFLFFPPYFCRPNDDLGAILRLNISTRPKKRDPFTLTLRCEETTFVEEARSRSLLGFFGARAGCVDSAY